MPCLGGRKKKNASVHHSEKPKTIVDNGDTAIVTQMKQDCIALKLKNEEHMALISRQSEELMALKQRIESNPKSNVDPEKTLAKLKSQHQETLLSLKQKEQELQEREAEIEKLRGKSKNEDLQSILDEKDKLIQLKESQIKEMKLNWEDERAQLIKPALEGISHQLEQLKRTNEDAQRRLSEKEGEVAELRSELNRRERTPSQRTNKTNDVEDQQKRLNRLTMDLENDRLMIQKLEELNQQLEAQKKQHEAVLQHHVKTIAEKDRELVEQQQSLTEIKTTHHHAVKALERSLQSSMAELKHHHEENLKQLKLRLGHAERQAKSDMNTEVEKLLHEFEQSEHHHTEKLANLQKSHHEQLSVMKKDQQAQIQHHLKKQNSESPRTESAKSTPNTMRKTSKVLRWPAMEASDDCPELIPKDPAAIHVYISSVSANSKRNQEAMETLLNSHQIQYQLIDVAQREPALQHMRRQTNGKTVQLPLVFVGGAYRGQLDDLRKAANLSDFLAKKRTRDLTYSNPAEAKNTFSQAISASKPVVNIEVNEEDESLLLELEKELESSHGLNFNF
ncbi:hypothetical protein BC941DRAFT_467126 [Chlamydoabsidia padenii]|nr:hypothetical protein BC941DRAFT_467126 [Chlamydoabsidia padenii]